MPPMAWRERARARKNADVLDAAERVFQRRRYHHATMEDIARDAGFSVGTLYNLFANKDDLYTQVILRAGREIVSRIEAAIPAEDSPEKALERVIRLRLSNYVKDRLFFELFLYPTELGIQPDPAKMDPGAVELFRRYMGTVESLFLQLRGGGHPRVGADFHYALSLEGILAAFMSFWAGPRQSDSVARTATQIRDLLLRGVGVTEGGGAAPPPAPVRREICLSSFDLERLRELITVARTFGMPSAGQCLDLLDSELARAYIVEPRNVPPDLITMNSKVRLCHVGTGESRVVALVFPKDAEAYAENESVLSPLGAAMLGYRVGGTFEVSSAQGSNQYRVEQILYQPEAAGDYHL